MRTFPILLAAAGFAGAVASTAVAGGETAAIKQAVQAFTTAADNRDVAAMKDALHSEFRVVFVTRGTRGATVLARDAYVGMLEAGKIGGVERTLVVENVDTFDGLATVRYQLTGEAAVFRSTASLTKTDDGWKMVQDAVVFEPNQ